MEQLLVFLIPACILWAWLSSIGFTNRTIEGAIIDIIPIPLLARLKRHAVPHAVAAGIALGLAIAGIASFWWLVLVLVSAIAIVSVAQSYTVTTRGIRVGWGNFRRWTEFAGVHRSRAGVTLQTIRHSPGMPIWLSGSRGDDEFVHLLRTLVRNSYKGKPTPLAVSPMSGMKGTAAPELPGIAAFTRETSSALQDG